MRISYVKYPGDIILCLLWSTILIPFTLFNVDGPLRVILGLPFLLFIPGYLLILVLFPAKKRIQGIDLIERLALSIGLSIAIVPLIGLGLNYSPWGIFELPVFFSILLTIYLLGILGWYRWQKTPTQDRFIFTLNLRFPHSETKLDKALTLILTLSIILSVSILVYLIATPRIGERFTEFYLLGPDDTADSYPDDLTTNENATVIIGIANHEYKPIMYTVEIWLINQTSVYNETQQDTMTTIHHMWFMDKITTTLNHSTIDLETSWSPQWEYTYNFSINTTGHNKLAFLLFIEATDDYTQGLDYHNIADDKLNKAYRDLHLWLHIT